MALLDDTLHNRTIAKLHGLNIKTASSQLCDEDGKHTPQMYVQDPKTGKNLKIDELGDLGFEDSVWRFRADGTPG